MDQITFFNRWWLRKKKATHKLLYPLAIKWCKEYQFWDWLVYWGWFSQNAQTHCLASDSPVAKSHEAQAKSFIYNICQIKSLNELDSNLYAVRAFRELIEKPYMHWLEGLEKR